MCFGFVVDRENWGFARPSLPAHQCVLILGWFLFSSTTAKPSAFASNGCCVPGAGDSCIP